MLKIQNTLTRKKEEFKPIKNKAVSFYQCGPTVYWLQHLGNMRAMVLADLIWRSLEYLGYKVKFVRNYTDVGHLTSNEDSGQDKMEMTAKKEKLMPEQIAAKYIKIFEADVKDLNCQEPEYKPRATAYIKPMAKMAQMLLDKGYTYATDLAIYFDISKAKDYTRLSGQDLSKNISQAGQGEVSDGGKKNPADFAIWFFKAGIHQNALQTWAMKFKLPTGEIIKKAGFPGWHLECSAMNKVLLGETVDLHMGGIEHVPVHHTNEIAQSEAANGVKFVNYWLHNEHLTIDGAKMSKTGGTAYSLADLKAKGYEPLALRYFFLQAHYRSQQNFTWEALESSKIALNNLREKIFHWEEFKESKLEKKDRKEAREEYLGKFKKAIEDDFNIPLALGIMWDLISDYRIRNKDAKEMVFEFNKVFGLNLKNIKKEIIPSEIKILAKKRQEYRINKNWKEADFIRREIENNGYIINDGLGDAYDIWKKY